MYLSIFRYTCRRAAARIMSCDGRRMMSSGSGEPSTISPWLMLSDRSGSGAGHKFYSLASKKVVSFKKEEAEASSEMLVGSSHGWLALVDIVSHDLFLSDPINGHRMKLPDIHTLPADLCRSRDTLMIIEKLILTSSPSADDCVAVMWFGSRGMALCRPGDDKWTHAGNGFYDDAVYARRRRRLYCITRAHPPDEPEVIECWDLTNYHHPTLEWKVSTSDLLQSEDEDDEDEEDEAESNEDESDDDDDDESSIDTSAHLMFSEQSDQLFLVRRDVLTNIGVDGSNVKTIYVGADRSGDFSKPHHTSSFEVHEIVIDGDGDRGKLHAYNRSLNGLAMFIGNNHAFALRAEDFPELKPDCIYFTEPPQFMPLPIDIRDYKNHGGHDIGVFNYVDKTVSSVYYPRHASQIAKIIPPPIWFTPTPH